MSEQPPAGAETVSDDWDNEPIVDDEPEPQPTERERLGIPSGRLLVIYTSGDDTVLRAALQADDHEKATRYFEVWRTQGHSAIVIASAPSPR